MADKKRKAKKPRINPHSKKKVAAIKATGATSVEVATPTTLGITQAGDGAAKLAAQNKAEAKDRKKKEQRTPDKARVGTTAHVMTMVEQADAVREYDEKQKLQSALQAKLAEEAAGEALRLTSLGLVEVIIHDCRYKLVGLADPKAEPTTVQRVEMAKRINLVGPLLPRYIKTLDPITPERTVASAIQQSKLEAAVTPKEKKQIEKDFAIDAKEMKAKEKARMKDEAKKLKYKLQEQKRIARNTKKIDPRPKISPEEVAQEKAAAKGKKVVATTAKKAPAQPKKKKDMTPGKVPAGGFTASNKPATSGELIRARIMEHKVDDEAIAAEVRKLWPGRTTGVTDVRWNRGQMLVHGVKNVPDPVGGEPEKKGKGKK